MQKNKNTIFILAVIYLSFFTIGMPNAAFGIAWPDIRSEMMLPLDWAFIIFSIQSLSYALTSTLNGRISLYIKIENINLLGVSLILFGLLGFFLSPNFIVMACMGALLGTGLGLMDSSLNAYMAKNFTSRYMSWLHCFWGIGAMISPIIMSQMIILHTWRTGYAAISAIQGIVLVLVFTSLMKGIWQVNERSVASDPKGINDKHFLTKKRFQYLQILIFFIHVSIESSITLWMPSVLLGARNFDIEVAGLFSSVYFASIMGSRLIFGYLANKLNNITILRFGYSIAIVGFILLIFSDSIVGMALIGVGLGPVFPCLMHETTNRFNPAAVVKLVGYQVAAGRVGAAVLSSLTGRVLTQISLESLFPVLIIFIMVCFSINELLAKRLGRV